MPIASLSTFFFFFHSVRLLSFLSSNIGRTYFIDATEEQKQVYLLLTDVYMACKKLLKHGTKLSAVYAAAQRAITDAKRPDLLSHFTKTAGFSIGLEFREGTLVLNDKNPKTLQKGMVFNLAIGFSDLTTKATKATDGKAKPYAVFIADTFYINGDDAESLTKQPREFKDVSYSMAEEGADDDAGADKEAEAAMAAAAASDRRATRGVGKDALRVDMAAEESDAKRTAHQKMLAQRKAEEALKRLVAGSMEDTGASVSSFDLTKHTIYDSVAALPPARNHVVVDSAHDAVLFPINDQLVPFHISTILRVYKRDENGFTYLNVKLQVPDTAANRAKMKVQKGQLIHMTTS
jgi:nucleosome binding factor SPN SPT16 subunit